MTTRESLRKYVSSKVGERLARDVRFSAQYLYDEGFSIKEIAAAYDVDVADLKINTMTTREAVTNLYASGLSIESISYVANKSVNWVYSQLNPAAAVYA